MTLVHCIVGIIGIALGFIARLALEGDEIDTLREGIADARSELQTAKLDAEEVERQAISDEAVNSEREKDFEALTLERDALSNERDALSNERNSLTEINDEQAAMLRSYREAKAPKRRGRPPGKKNKSKKAA